MPGPAIRSTRCIVSVPRAIAATAWTPPRIQISSAPARCIAATVAAGISPRIGGVQATTRGTPATLAVTMVMWAEAVSGYLPFFWVSFSDTAATPAAPPAPVVAVTC